MFTFFLFDINSYTEKHSLWTAFMSKKGRVFYIYNLRPFLGFAEILCYLLQQKRPWIYHQNMIFFISPASIIKMTKRQTIGWQINFSNNNYYWKTLFWVYFPWQMSFKLEKSLSGKNRDHIMFLFLSINSSKEEYQWH